MMFDYSEPRTYSVLRLTGPTGLKYYGMTRVRYRNAWNDIFRSRRNGRLRRDVKAYSRSAFKEEIVADSLSLEEAKELLREMISKEKTDNPEFGYNFNGGPLGAKEYDVYVMTFPDGKRYVGMTSSVKNRWRRGYKSNAVLYDAINRAGGIKNVKKEHFAYPLSRESAERIEATLIDYFQTMDSEKGYNRTRGAAFNESDVYFYQETIEKMRQAKAGVAKPVRCIETGEVFQSACEAERRMNQRSNGHILAVCNGKEKTSAGYHWEFVNEKDKKKNEKERK